MKGGEAKIKDYLETKLTKAKPEPPSILPAGEGTWKLPAIRKMIDRI